MTCRLTRRWWQFHSWLGLISGLGLLVIGLSGSILVFQDELDAWRRPSIYRTTPRTGGRLSLDQLWATTQRALPGWTIADWTLPRDAGYSDLLRVYPPGETREIRKLHVDPYTSEMLGSPATYPHTLSGFLLILHTSFFGGIAGTFVVDLFAIALLLLGISGLWLYRDFWKSFFTLRWRSSARIFFSDFHKTIGIISVLFNFVLGFTGAWWNTQSVYHSLISKPDAAPSAPASVVPFNPSQVGISLDTLVAEARRQLPGFRVTSLALPATDHGEIILSGGVPTINPFRSDFGSSVVFSSPGGALVRVDDIRRLSFWTQVQDNFSPLHFGTFGGLPVKILWCFGGLAPGLLATSGFVIWRKRVSRPTRSLWAGLS